MKIGDIVDYDGKKYIFLGTTQFNKKIGWFTHYPIHPLHPGFESEAQIFAWFIHIFIGGKKP